MQTSAASPRFSGGFGGVLSVAREPLLFGIRLWASVCLALFVAFWLELENPFWAGASAAIVCLPQVGASLRKAWFRMIGTVIGATMIVVLTACCPQDRIAFLALLAFWFSICAFAATVLRNYASYAASLAGYTAAIIAVDTFGESGGASPEVFWIAVWRASEISIGIVCAGIMLAGTDFGGAQRRLAASFAGLATEITGRFIGMLATVGPQVPDTQLDRRELVRRVVALDPLIDQALGESSRLRYYELTVQAAVRGFFRALNGWRGVATHLSHLPAGVERQEAQAVLRCIPPELRSAANAGASALWTSDPLAQQRVCVETAQTLRNLPTGNPALRLLADETAKLFSGLSHVLDGLALLVDARGHNPQHHDAVRVSVPDWLPGFVNAGRVFVATIAVELFWIVTAWPSGAVMIMMIAILLLLISPKGDLAYLGSIAVTLGATVSVLCAAIIKFAVLPAFDTFPALCFALGLILIPISFAIACSRKPAAMAVFTTIGFSFLTILGPTNEMNYDTSQFYNTALAIVAGCFVTSLAFCLLPPLSPAIRARRLLILTLRDLRRLASGSLVSGNMAWESRMYGRLAALPDQAEPSQRAQLLAALSVGTAIIRIRGIAHHVRGIALDTTLLAFAQGNITVTTSHLRQLDRDLASRPDAEADAADALRMRANILAVFEALADHATYFAGAPA